MPRTYTRTAGDIITKARVLLNDSAAPYRNDDPVMIQWLNDALNMALTANPALFSSTAAFTCSAGFRQILESTRAVAVLDVVGVPQTDAASLTQFLPGWHAAASGAIKNWMRVAQEPLAFEVYPPSAAGQSLTLHYVESPVPLTATTDLVPMSENYEPALVDYLVARASYVDDEHVLSGRATVFDEKFTQAVRAA